MPLSSSNGVNLDVERGSSSLKRESTLRRKKSFVSRKSNFVKSNFVLTLDATVVKMFSGRTFDFDSDVIAVTAEDTGFG
jgi:hypothetical protein